MNKLLLVIFIATNSVFAHISDGVVKKIKRSYSYKDWTKDEYRMLTTMLGEEHPSLGAPGIENDPDMLFRNGNKLLSAQIAKEIFYTESCTTVESMSIARLRSFSLTYGYTANEIVEMVRDNLYKLEEVPDFNNSILGLDFLMLQMLSAYADYEDLDLVDIVEERGKESSQQMAFIARKRITDRHYIGEKPQTEFEKNQMSTSRSRDSNVSEALPRERPEKPLPETFSSENNKPNSFPWWFLGIAGLIIALGFIFLRGRLK